MCALRIVRGKRNLWRFTQCRALKKIMSKDKMYFKITLKQENRTFIQSQQNTLNLQGQFAYKCTGSTAVPQQTFLTLQAQIGIMIEERMKVIENNEPSCYIGKYMKRTQYCNSYTPIVLILDCSLYVSNLHTEHLVNGQEKLWYKYH